jgi:hypothetical protein
MGRRNKNNRQSNPPAAKPVPSPQPSTGLLEEKLAKVEDAAKQQATEADLEAMETTPPPSPDDLGEDLVERASKMLALLKSREQRVEAREADLTRKANAVEAKTKEVEEGRSELEALRKEHAEDEADLNARQDKLAADEADLNERRAEILRREIDADAGFARRNSETLGQLEEQADTLRGQLGQRRQQMQDERDAFERELQEKRKQFEQEAEAERSTIAEARSMARKHAESELASQRDELSQERDGIEIEAKRLRKLARDLKLDQELLDEDKAAIDEKASRLAADQIERKDGEIRDLADRLKTARAERNRLEQRLVEREEADQRFGGETPDEVLKRMRGLERNCEQLKKALGERPSADAALRLEELERQKELGESDRLQLLAKLGELRQDAARKRIAVTELESLRDEKSSLESANDLLREAHRQVRAEVDDLVKSAEGKSPFPSCSEMDTDDELQSARPTTEEIPSLAQFTEDVRHSMARDPKTGKELYYSAEDVRSFVAGLAMSRLHLLQGISGTGKTSLPIAFARAIGTGAAVIEVQAGWRDRQDLIGHFNTFERRFYETEFLQAMYRASTPLYRDKPFFVILDEMNLSHPEQYFADMLSALEQDQERQLLALMTASVDSAPRLLKEGGKKMQIPPNVWFIGTANHDETTKDFADKTYDRAHVMELPRNRETFQRKSVQRQNPMSLTALQAVFDSAVEKHKDDAEKAYAFLEEELGDILGRRFQVGWGNRLERQMGFYVPVVVAAGGTVGEATDHVLATKLLRKLRDRHDNRPEDIIALRDRMQTAWVQLDSKHEPRRSLTLLTQELHRLGHDDV